MSATLASIRIKNFALVEDLTWTPGKGFNAISGETGAGKSILIGALKLLLGERADRSQIRAGAEQCAVEALFETSSPETIDALLADAGAESCEEGRLIIKRIVTQTTGRQFINGSPCNSSLLKELGDLLVDLHGPHDHQSLFSREEQTRLLDDFSGVSTVASEYREVRSRWLALVREQEALETGAQAMVREMELLRHQVGEIDGAELLPDEEEALHSSHRAMSNAHRIQELGSATTALLTENEPGLSSLCGDLGRILRDLTRLDERAASFESRQIEIKEQIGDLAKEVENYLGRIDSDPALLVEIEERLDLIGGLKRKYGNTIADILTFAKEARGRLQELESREERGGNLVAAIVAAQKVVEDLAGKLSKERKRGAAQLAKAVADQLLELGFRQAEFSLELEALAELGPHGRELAEFVFAPNPGEPAHPLRQIASSGEISRVMLALKCALAAQDRVALLVFDEIDANVGGETATKVGEKMLELGRNRQVLCITHLPQVASAASTHFLVEKQVREGRTISLLTLLGEEARELEIARMLGGKTTSAREHARTLLARKNQE